MRGFTVFLTWIVWPPLFYALYWIVNVMLATGRRCSIEGCDAPDGFLGFVWLAGVFVPPLFLTYRWFQWRRSNRSSAA